MTIRAQIWSKLLKKSDLQGLRGEIATMQETKTEKKEFFGRAPPVNDYKKGKISAERLYWGLNGNVSIIWKQEIC